MRTWLMLVAIALTGLSMLRPAAAETLTVFAAASLKEALDAVDQAWTSAGGDAVSASYAASSTLAKQIEQGAPADLFVSADRQWMEYLASRNLVGPARDIAANRLVLVARRENPVTLDIRPGVDLASALADGRLAVGDPSHVPAGLYAKEALEKLGVWAAVSNRLAPAADVRGALALVSRGEAALGIVYETDARIDPGVRIAGTFPDSSHTPILYPAAPVTASHKASAGKYLDFLASPTAQAIFGRYGFLSPTGTPR